MEDRRGAHGPDGSIQNVSATVEGRDIVLSSKKFALYKIKVAQGENTRYIFRRYSDFKLLKDQLQKANVLPHGFFSRTVLPGKHFHIRNKFSVTFLDARQDGLQRYLTELLKRPKITEVTRIIQFLGLDGKPPEPVHVQNTGVWAEENNENWTIAPNQLGNECMRQEVQDCQRQIQDIDKRLLEMEDFMKSILKKHAWSTYPVHVFNNK